MPQQIFEDMYDKLYQEKEDYKSRCEKAIEWLDYDNMENYFECSKKEMFELLSILQNGSDKE